MTTSNPRRGRARGQLASACRALLCMSLSITMTRCGLADLRTGSDPLRGETSRQVEAPPTLRYEYDAAGNLTRLERDTSATALAYDALGRNRTATDALAGTTSFGWSGSGRLGSVVDPRGVTTTYERSGLGEVLRQTSSDTGVVTQQLDEAGNVKERTDARGVTATLSHDALNRLTAVVYRRAGEPDHELGWTYDDTNGSAAAGRLTATRAPSVSAQLEYDGSGRLSAHTQVTGNLTRVTRYEYDSAGHLSAIVYPSGRRLTLTRSGGVVTALSWPLTMGAATPVVDGIRHDALGWAEHWRWALDTGFREHDVLRDAAGRIVRYPLGDGWRELEYDAGGRVVAYRHFDASGAAAPALDETFTYDAADRLTGFVHAGASHTASYDASGNRVALDATTLIVEPTSNRLVSSTSPTSTRTYVFDAAGNQLSDQERIATYDLSGRLATLTRAGETTRYAYDGDGRRVRKLGTGVDLTFVYDRAGNLLGEYDGAGAAVREYLWLEGTLVAFVFGGELFFVQTDHLGAPRVAFDRQGRERWSWRGNPFGEGAPNEDPSQLGAVVLPLRFPGQYADAESGFFYNHHRDYDPATGRYIESDPLGLRGGLNTYLYGLGAPTMNIDPEGTNVWALGGFVPGPIGVVVAVVGLAITGWAGLRTLANREPAWVDPQPIYARPPAGEDGAQPEPPRGSVGIDESDYSGNHGEIKRPLGLRGDDDVVVDPDGTVWVQRPDGMWVPEGHAADYTGSGEADGRTGKDRNRSRDDRRRRFKDKRSWDCD